MKIQIPLFLIFVLRIKSHGDLRLPMGHVIDIMATCIDVADASYPNEYKGYKIIPLEGKSLVPTFDNRPIEREALYWEHQATRAIRMGKWKLVADKNTEPPYEGEWELYDMKEDRTELNNLAEKYPERVKTMAEVWHQWAERCNVLPLDGRGWFPRLEKKEK